MRVAGEQECSVERKQSLDKEMTGQMTLYAFKHEKARLNNPIRGQ